MNAHDIIDNNQNFLDEHFNIQRRGLYAKRILPEEVEEKFAARLAEEIWLELNEQSIPNNISDKEKANIFLKLWPMVLEKRKSKPPFQFYKKYDLKELKNEILNLDEKYWYIAHKKIENQRIHKNTQIIGNTLFPLYYNGNGYINVVKNDYIPRNIQLKIDQIVSELEFDYNGKVLISGITKLPAGDKIAIHVDDVYYFKIIKRFQIAISTNSKVFFNIDEETKVFEEGDCYQINNLLKHSIFNEGETDRINLIVDILPWDKIKSYAMHYQERIKI
jgi:Aspartyl/Asparaginyl beta-hydroxylase